MPRQSIALLLLVVSGFALEGCQVVGNYEEFERGAPPAPSAPTRECDAIDSPKSVQAGPLLVLIDDPDATCFWMDQTEVSVVEYRGWLDALGGTIPDWGDDATCSALKSANARPFDPDEPDRSCLIPEPRPSDPDPFADELPIRCITWCEADAYCRWAGKRLCNVSTPTSNDEWQIACSAGYTRTYPFEPSPQGHPCNYGQECASGCGPLPVAQDTQCRPGEGYPLNLGGNVTEWVERPGFTRGGSYLSPQKDLACTSELFVGVSDRDARVGFRCCASLTSAERSRLPG